MRKTIDLIKKIYPPIEAITPVTCLVLVHACVFIFHYTGFSIFRWDFNAAYYGMPYAWYADGHFFDPLLWSPYTNFGYPTHLALQNGSFYLPLALLDYLNIHYTLVVATILQCLHILFGSLGLYVFLRANGFSKYTSVLGGILFHFAAGFFSNAQHADIIRGYAYIPWLFLICSHRYMTLNSRSIVVAALTMFLFVTGSYPGIVVAAFYNLLVYVIFQGFNGPKKPMVYFSRLAVSGAIAVGLSMVKFLPLLLMRSEIERHLPNHGPLDLTNIFTILFRYDLRFLNYDATMRSIYLPPLAIVLLFYIFKLTRKQRFALGMLALNFLMFFDFELIQNLVLKLPGMTSSRFHLADFRGFFHFWLILLACSGLRSLLTNSVKPTRIMKRTAGASLAIFIFYDFALNLGYRFKTTRLELFFVGITIASMLLLIVVQGKPTRHSQWFLPYLWLISIAASIGYLSHFPITWTLFNHHQWVPIKYKVSSYDDIYKPGARRTQWPQRPERTQIESKRFLVPAGNIAHIRQEFHTDAYDNAIKFETTGQLKALVAKPEGQWVKKFMMDQGTVISAQSIDDESLHAAIRDRYNDESAYSNDPSNIQVISFEQESITYKVQTDDVLYLVENEAFFPGWRSELLFDDRQEEGPSATRVLGGLRAWKIPAGNYRLRTYYLPPMYLQSWLIFWVSVAVCVALLVGPWLAHTFRKTRSDQPS